MSNTHPDANELFRFKISEEFLKDYAFASVL
jgi:hypothetical protein